MPTSLILLRPRQGHTTVNNQVEKRENTVLFLEFARAYSRNPTQLFCFSSFFQEGCGRFYFLSSTRPVSRPWFRVVDCAPGMSRAVLPNALGRYLLWLAVPVEHASCLRFIYMSGNRVEVLLFVVSTVFYVQFADVSLPTRKTNPSKSIASYFKLKLHLRIRTWKPWFSSFGNITSDQCWNSRCILSHGKHYNNNTKYENMRSNIHGQQIFAGVVQVALLLLSLFRLLNKIESRQTHKQIHRPSTLTMTDDVSWRFTLIPSRLI